MAQRDYVKKKNKPKNNSRLIPNIMMTIAVLLVVLFVAILYFVSTNKKPKPTNQTPAVVTQKPQDTLPEKPQERWTYLKELENPQSGTTEVPPTNNTDQVKERQNALDNFMNDKVNSTANTSTIAKVTTNKTENAVTTTKTEKTAQAASTQPPVTSGKQFLMQCGAFKDKANAESLKAKLAMFGVTSYIKSEKFHRVLAGPYSSRAEVDKTIATLKTNGISSCINTSK